MLNVDYNGNKELVIENPASISRYHDFHEIAKLGHSGGTVIPRHPISLPILKILALISKSPNGIGPSMIPRSF